MISNIDPKQLDLILTFSNFLEVLNNPTIHSAYVKDAKETLLELKSVLKAKATVEGADKYSEQVLTNLANETNKLGVERAEFESYVIDQKDALDLRKEDLNKMERKLVSKEADLQKQERELRERQEAAVQMEADLFTRKAELETREKYIVQQDEELRAKAAQIKTLLG